MKFTWIDVGRASTISSKFYAALHMFSIDPRSPPCRLLRQVLLHRPNLCRRGVLQLLGTTTGVKGDNREAKEMQNSKQRTPWGFIGSGSHGRQGISNEIRNYEAIIQIPNIN